MAGSQEEMFRSIVVAYQERLYWHIRKIVYIHEDTDDLLQETFLKVWKHLDSFRGASNLYTWIYRIATNEALAFLRKKRIDVQDIADHMYEGKGWDTLDADSIELALQKALAALPDKQRIVFNMRYFDDMPFKEIASILETSVGGLKANYHHAAKKVEHILKQQL